MGVPKRLAQVYFLSTYSGCVPRDLGMALGSATPSCWLSELSHSCPLFPWTIRQTAQGEGVLLAMTRVQNAVSQKTVVWGFE